jgi:hypothetical protein
MFSPVNEFVVDYIQGKPSVRYSPLDVANWLERFASIATEQLETAKQNVPDTNTTSFKRMYIDVSAQSALGRFFANKLRAATAFMIYEKNGKTDDLSDAISFYMKARDSWQNLIEITEDVYVEELGFGDPVKRPHISGHWKDRLPAIEADIKVMQKLWEEETGESFSKSNSTNPALKDWMKTRPPLPACGHDVPENFHPGKPLEITLNSESPLVQNIKLHYRHVNQVEEYNIVAMRKENGVWQFKIPADFTDSEYHLMYFFEIIDSNNNAWIFPGFNGDLANQPYYHVLCDD